MGRSKGQSLMEDPLESFQEQRHRLYVIPENFGSTS